MNQYFVTVYKDNGQYDEYEIEAESLSDAWTIAAENNGWADVGEVCIELIPNDEEMTE
jgi:hypothetical protein